MKKSVLCVAAKTDDPIRYVSVRNTGGEGTWKCSPARPPDRKRALRYWNSEYVLVFKEHVDRLNHIRSDVANLQAIKEYDCLNPCYPDKQGEQRGEQDAVGVDGRIDAVDDRPSV
jgi:hypothetical protein